MPSPAAAAEHAKIQAALNKNGDGLMIVNSQTNPPDETWSWEVCQPDLTSCNAFTTGRQITTAGAPSDVVFRATSTRGAVAVSPIWHGRVTAVTPPSITGELRVNALVTPTHGEWSGGWGRDYFSAQLAACETPAGERCITLTDDQYTQGCADDAAVIDPAFEGEYLRVAETNYGQDAAFPDYALLSAYSRMRVWPEAPTTSASVVGQIGPAVGPREADCGPPTMPFAAVSKSGFVDVECLRACRVVVVIRGRDRAIRRGRDLGELSQARIPVGRRLLNRVLPGPVTVTAEVDGRVLSRRTIRRSVLEGPPGNGVISGSIRYVGGPPGTCACRAGGLLLVSEVGGGRIEAQRISAQESFRFELPPGEYLIETTSGDAQCQDIERELRGGQRVRLRVTCSVR